MKEVKKDLQTSPPSWSDRGRPVVLSHPNSLQAQAFIEVAKNLAAQISIRNMAGEDKQEIKISF